MRFNTINVLSFGCSEYSKSQLEARSFKDDPIDHDFFETCHCGTTQPFDDDFEGYGSRPVPPPLTPEEIQAINERNQFIARESAKAIMANTQKMSAEEFTTYYDSLYPGSEEDRVDPKHVLSHDDAYFPDDSDY